MTKEIRGIVSEPASKHPLDVAARLAGLFSSQNYEGDRIDFVRVRDIDHPTVCDLSGFEGDPVGLSFSFYGMEGEEGLIYLTTTFAQVTQHGANPGPHVPAAMISRFVPEYDEAVRNLVIQRTPCAPSSITLN